MEDLIVEYKAGEFLFKEGDLSKDLYIVQSGIVSVYRQSSGGQIFPLALIHAGGFVGEMSFFDGKPRSATAEAVTEVKVLKFDPVRLDKEIKKLPPWLLVIIKGLADRVRDANDLVKRNRVVDSFISEEFQKWDAAKGKPIEAKKAKK